MGGQQVGVVLLHQAETDRSELVTGVGVRVDVQVGGGRAGLQLVPGQPRVARGGDDSEPGQFWLAAAVDGDRALADTTLPPAAGRGTQTEEYEAHHRQDDTEQTK